MIKKGISVIIPVLNADAFCYKCIDSVINQNFQEKEIIIITTIENINKLKKTFDDYTIKYIESSSNEDSGTRRNIGIEYSRNKYIFFIDSDDELYSVDSLLKLYRAIECTGVKICGGSCIIRDEYKNKYYCRKDLTDFSFSHFNVFKNFQYETGFYRFIYDSEFLKAKIRFPSLKRFQDAVFFVNAMINADKFYLIPDIVYIYKKNHKKITWNVDMWNDHYKGVFELLKISYLNNYRCLAKRMLQNINNANRLRTLKPYDFKSLSHQKKIFLMTLLKMNKLFFYMPVAYLKTIITLVKWNYFNLM
ncbi:glycosyltransferase [Succinatimonas hippei]|uniref:glycosyltransferase family 2 protein n=1 Tax=Succinatimonas hippei TaxID=626938 RepID=UPI0026EFA895|nr:glycosyltransferase [Succinatimonas hippei]